ncbi:hypothetical protein QLX08_005204 [Tetragonisca angustula]|uniref:Uncharacterized protein n=1 Tax=Tetragonisca angustula TaxID=166442 RepID=A0AAW0ZZ32_9HYME
MFVPIRLQRWSGARIKSDSAADEDEEEPETEEVCNAGVYEDEVCKGVSTTASRWYHASSIRTACEAALSSDLSSGRRVPLRFVPPPRLSAGWPLATTPRVSGSLPTCTNPRILPTYPRLSV